MKKITQIAHELLCPYVQQTSICADFTMGNGNDTLFFAQRAINGFVYAFDIQEQALTETQKRLGNNYPNVQFIKDNHIYMEQYIKTKLNAAVFNFGYLPNGSQTLTTKASDSLCAVQKAFQLCDKHALLVLVCYPGHEEGRKESRLIGEWCATLSSQTARIMKAEMVNKPQSPFLFALEKL